MIVTDLRSEDHPAARALILKGLEEHWGRLDPTKNPDLDDIAGNYAHAVFLGAWSEGKLAGTGALVPETEGVGRIVRMSVDRSQRRQGIGRIILEELCHRARQLGYHRLVLETTETWQDAIGFYRDFGFSITHYAEGDVHFEVEIDESRESRAVKRQQGDKAIRPRGNKRDRE